MPIAARGEVWIADLGMVGKVRPVLILSVAYGDAETRAYYLRSKNHQPARNSLRSFAFEPGHAGRRILTASN